MYARSIALAVALLLVLTCSAAMAQCCGGYTTYYEPAVTYYAPAASCSSCSSGGCGSSCSSCGTCDSSCGSCGGGYTSYYTPCSSCGMSYSTYYTPSYTAYYVRPWYAMY